MMVTNKQWAEAARKTLRDKWGDGYNKMSVKCALCDTTIVSTGDYLMSEHLRLCSGCAVYAVFGSTCMQSNSPAYGHRRNIDLVVTCLALIIAIYETGGTGE